MVFQETGLNILENSKGPKLEFKKATQGGVNTLIALRIKNYPL